MKKVLPQRARIALIYSILVFASVHMLVLVLYAVKTASIAPLNLFYILQVHLLFPETADGAGWFVGGIGIGIFVYSIVYINRRF